VGGKRGEGYIVQYTIQLVYFAGENFVDLHVHVAFLWRIAKVKINLEKVLHTTISGTSSVFISVALTCKIIPERVLTIPKLVGPLSMAAPASTITAAN